VLVPHKTPGHTRGCATWTTRTTQQDKPVNVVIMGSWNVNPGFAVLKGFPYDIFLGAHGQYFDMLAN
jgi:metallo-beta-lactamase class B